MRTKQIDILELFKENLKAKPQLNYGQLSFLVELTTGKTIDFNSESSIELDCQKHISLLSLLGRIHLLQLGLIELKNIDSNINISKDFMSNLHIISLKSLVLKSKSCKSITFIDSLLKDGRRLIEDKIADSLIVNNFELTKEKFTAFIECFRKAKTIGLQKCKLILDEKVDFSGSLDDANFTTLDLTGSGKSEYSDFKYTDTLHYITARLATSTRVNFTLKEIKLIGCNTTKKSTKNLPNQFKYVT
jgi:hypothetical protein